MSWATTLAKRPSGTPAASTTCQSWLMSSGVAVKVFIRSAASGLKSGSKPGQTHKIAGLERVGQGREKARADWASELATGVSRSPFPFAFPPIDLRKHPQLRVALRHLVDGHDHGGGAEIDLAAMLLPGLPDRMVGPDHGLFQAGAHQIL